MLEKASFLGTDGESDRMARMAKFNFQQAIDDATPEQVRRVAKALNIEGTTSPASPAEHLGNLFLIWQEQQRSIADFQALLAEPAQPLPDSTSNE